MRIVDRLIYCYARTDWRWVEDKALASSKRGGTPATDGRGKGTVIRSQTPLAAGPVSNVGSKSL